MKNNLLKNLIVGTLLLGIFTDAEAMRHRRAVDQIPGQTSLFKYFSRENQDQNAQQPERSLRQTTLRDFFTVAGNHGQEGVGAANPVAVPMEQIPEHPVFERGDVVNQGAVAQEPTFGGFNMGNQIRGFNDQPIMPFSRRNKCPEAITLEEMSFGNVREWSLNIRKEFENVLHRYNFSNAIATITSQMYKEWTGLQMYQLRQVLGIGPVDNARNFMNKYALICVIESERVLVEGILSVEDQGKLITDCTIKNFISVGTRRAFALYEAYNEQRNINVLSRQWGF